MKKNKTKLVFVLGIRPDLIRSALIMKHLEKVKDVEVVLIWSGQNYSYNLKDIFFKELRVRCPDITLDCKGKTDAEVTSKLISQLYPVLEKINPDAVVILGDTNTCMACIAAAQLNIPIIHIEGCWHSYDWRMPEEKYRTIADHLADIIYTYADEYKERGLAEGLNPKNIVVVGNPVVDILNVFYFSQKEKLEKKATKKFFKSKGIEDGKYYLMTCHRRENVHIQESFKAIMNLIAYTNTTVYFAASYRTQGVMKEYKIEKPKNLIVVDPVGYEEILLLMTHSIGVITDSGTLNEEACVLGVPCINIRKATERPQVYDVQACVKFDPDKPEMYNPDIVFRKLDKISGTSWKHTFGDGRASERIANDIIHRLRTGTLRGFLPENNHLPIARSFMEDGIKI